MRCSLLPVAACAAAAVLCGAAGAQNYPVRPVTMVVPFGPGAGTDLEARIYAQKLSEVLHQPFVIEYKPGAGTTVGAAYVAKAAPDGYTLLVTSSSFTSSPALYAKLPYDPIKDFAPVSLMSQRTTVAVAYTGASFNNVPEYIAYAKANPGKVNVGTTGAGGSPHLNGAWFHNLTNTKVTFIHYKNSAIGLTDLGAGRVDVIFTTAFTANPHVQSGKVKVLGIGNAERSAMLPGMPTLAEQGVPGYDYTSIIGIVASAAVPPAIINRLSAELAKVAKAPGVAEKMGDGAQLVGSTPQQYLQLIVKEIARYKKIVEDNNIKLEE